MMLNNTRIKSDGGDYVVLLDYGTEGMSVLSQHDDLQESIKALTECDYSSQKALVKLVRFDLQEEPSEETEKLRSARLDEKPYWHVERCRIDQTRTVPVELIVNGEVARTEILVADGNFRSFEFDVEIDKSAWVGSVSTVKERIQESQGITPPTLYWTPV